MLVPGLRSGEELAGKMTGLKTRHYNDKAVRP